MARDVNAELKRAVIENKGEVAVQLLSEGADANAVNADGQTPLMLAAICASNKCVEPLINAGAKLDIYHERLGYSPLYFALLNRVRGNIENMDALIRTICSNGAAKMPLDRDESFSAAYCFAQFSCDLLAQLVTAGQIDIEKFDKDGRTALTKAASVGDVGIVHALLAAGADVNRRDIRNKTPLMCAAKYNHRPVIELLFQQPDLDYKALRRLSTAVSMANEPATKQLIKNKIQEKEAAPGGRMGWVAGVLQPMDPGRR